LKYSYCWSGTYFRAVIRQNKVWFGTTGTLSTFSNCSYCLPTKQIKDSRLFYRYQDITLDIDKVYRFLDKLNDTLKEQVEQISYAHTLKVLEGRISVVFYDMTTLYFEAEDEDDLRKTSFSKDGKHSESSVLPLLFL